MSKLSKLLKEQRRQESYIRELEEELSKLQEIQQASINTRNVKKAEEAAVKILKVDSRLTITKEILTGLLKEIEAQSKVEAIKEGFDYLSKVLIPKVRDFQIKLGLVNQCTSTLEGALREGLQLRAEVTESLEELKKISPEVYARASEIMGAINLKVTKPFYHGDPGSVFDFAMVSPAGRSDALYIGLRKKRRDFMKRQSRLLRNVRRNLDGLAKRKKLRSFYIG